MEVPNSDEKTAPCVLRSLPTKRRDVEKDAVSELRKLRADHAGRIDRYPKDNPRGATARPQWIRPL